MSYMYLNIFMKIDVNIYLDQYEKLYKYVIMKFFYINIKNYINI